MLMTTDADITLGQNPSNNISMEESFVALI